MRGGSRGSFAFTIAGRVLRDDQELNRQTPFSRRVAGAPRGATKAFHREEASSTGVVADPFLSLAPSLALLCASAALRESGLVASRKPSNLRTFSPAESQGRRGGPLHYSSHGNSELRRALPNSFLSSLRFLPFSAPPRLCASRLLSFQGMPEPLFSRRGAETQREQIYCSSYGRGCSARVENSTHPIPATRIVLALLCASASWRETAVL